MEMITETPFLQVVNESQLLCDEAPFDIVFVHGLNLTNTPNHAYATWTHQNGVFWPKALFPKIFPNARILLFGYNSNVAWNWTATPFNYHASELLDQIFKSRSTAEKRDRPLCFIAHSLGGLVVKQALIQAALEKTKNHIKRATFALTFFATPHRGGNGVSIAQTVSNAIIRLSGHYFSTNDILEVLKPASANAESVTGNFRYQLEDYYFLSFFETKSMRLLFGMISFSVVDRHSALLGLAGSREEQCAVEADHCQICKFAGDDYRYRFVTNKIKDFLERSLELWKAKRSSSEDDERASTSNAVIQGPLLKETESPPTTTVEETPDYSLVEYTTESRLKESRLDLSIFDNSHYFERFVLDIRKFPTSVEFSEVLRDVVFPDLGSPVAPVKEDYRMEYFEAEHVLQWLKTKGVKKIVKIKVPDRLVSAHEDRTVCCYVKAFCVRHLDWRKLDLCLDGLDEGHTIETLHLYSSGNRAVVDHWLRKLPTLSQLRRLYIAVVEDVMSDRIALKLQSELKQLLENLNARLSYPWDEVEVFKARWTGLEARNKIDYGGDQSLEQIASKAVPSLTTFISKYEQLMADAPLTRIKICVIGSGLVVAEQSAPTKIDTLDPPLFGGNISGRLRQGISFTKSIAGEEQPWWHASEAHGTQLTRLICSIDPRSELYIAKVCESTHSLIEPHLIAKAVHWATAMKVDIIVFDPTLDVSGQGLSALMEAIQYAAYNDVVVMCSPQKNIITQLRSNSANAFLVEACDLYGNLLDRLDYYLEWPHFVYRVVGVDIFVGTVPFVQSTDYVSGNLPAVAIASGLASLILSCYKLAHSKRINDPSWRRDAIEEMFRKMCFPGTTLVKLSNLLGGRNCETGEFEKLIMEIFGDHDRVKEAEEETLV